MRSLRPLTDYLDLVLPRLPDALASAPSRRHLTAVARRFAAVPMFGFETRLGEADPRLDFFLLLDNAFADVEFPGRPDPLALLPELDRGQPAWGRIAGFCDAYRRREQATMAEVTGIWLEFDLANEPVPEEEGGLPLPSVFVGVRDRRASDRQAPLATGYVADLEAAVEALTGERLSPPARRRLDAIVRATADHSAGYHVGVMLSRGAARLRVCPRRIDARTWLGCARDAGWAGDPGELADALAPAFAICPDPIVHLDLVDDEVGPALGFDFSLARSFIEGQPRDEPRWHAMLDWMASAGLAVPGKRDALLAWPGGARVVDHERTAPVPGPTFLIRGLNHLKVVYGHAGTLTAKAYFGCLHYEPAAGPSSAPGGQR